MMPHATSTLTPSADRSIAPIRIGRWIRRHLTLSDRAATGGSLPEALERLALTSPHLLEDIGLERDRAQSGPGRAQWHDRTHCVTLTTAPATATVVAARGPAASAPAPLSPARLP